MISYSKMFNANDSSMNGTCYTYVYNIQQKRQTTPQKSIMTNSFFFK